MRLAFELDPEIIHHIIYSQAGSIGKAIIELLMNAVDAGATSATLLMSENGFRCEDNGKGFAHRRDVIRHFGRFGTPHVDGDAKYGRFRLGRGQIMAHAKTLWLSKCWSMSVDTRSMGYGYELEKLHLPKPGCTIEGEWYEPLTYADLMSAVQEVKDLMRYASILITVNEHVISRDPRSERWDCEDEFAYYRVKESGAVSIYNQGVLVRQDPGHIWGAGGTIVTKKAIALNVSRTEILRKTCAVWKEVAKNFGVLADEIGDISGHRKTEERREKTARSLLSSHEDSMLYFTKEEVITILPGKKHLTLHDFLYRARRRNKIGGEDAYSIVEHGRDVPLGESVTAQQGIVVIHPQTLERFGCLTAQEFVERLSEILKVIHVQLCRSPQEYWAAVITREPQFLHFQALKDSFKERTFVISEKTLDAETRRVWVALRGCICHYANLVTGGRKFNSGYVQGGLGYQILLGESNSAQAWTDGSSYIAIEKTLVMALKNSPLLTASHIFALVDHEIAHEGDSLLCGHDDEFRSRYHDLSLSFSMERQRYLQMWVLRYTESLKAAGKTARTRSAQKREQLDSLDAIRKSAGLASMLGADRTDVPAFDDAAEDAGLLERVNTKLRKPQLDNCEEITWSDLCTASDAIKNTLRKEESERQQQLLLDEKEQDDLWQAYDLAEAQLKERVATILNVEVAEFDPEVWDCLSSVPAEDHATLRSMWGDKPWLNIVDECQVDDFSADDQIEDERIDRQQRLADLRRYREELQGITPGENPGGESDCLGESMNYDDLDPNWSEPVPHYLSHLSLPHETAESVRKNASAAGFRSSEDYLKWRQ